MRLLTTAILIPVVQLLPAVIGSEAHPSLGSISLSGIVPLLFRLLALLGRVFLVLGSRSESRASKVRNAHVGAFEGSLCWKTEREIAKPSWGTQGTKRLSLSCLGISQSEPG